MLHTQRSLVHKVSTPTPIRWVRRPRKPLTDVDTSGGGSAITCAGSHSYSPPLPLRLDTSGQVLQRETCFKRLCGRVSLCAL